MNRRIIIAALAPLPLLMGAQTAYDAYQISRYDLRGTARFMSMELSVPLEAISPFSVRTQVV